MRYNQITTVNSPVTHTICVKSYNESIQNGYRICHRIVSYTQSIYYGYRTSSNGISIMYQLRCLTRSNYNIPIDSSKLLHSTRLHDDPRLLNYYYAHPLPPSQANLAPTPSLPMLMSSHHRSFSAMVMPSLRRRRCCRLTSDIAAMVRVYFVCLR